MRRLVLILPVLLLLLAASPPAWAAVDLDPAYGSGGLATGPRQGPGSAEEIVIDARGGTLVLGQDTDSAGRSVPYVRRVGPGGRLDSAYGQDGTVSLADRFLRVTDLLVVGQRTLVVGFITGFPSQGGGFVVYALGSDGRRDETFGTDGRALIDVGPVTRPDNAVTARPLSRGRLLVFGTGQRQIEDTMVAAVLDSDGRLDRTSGRRGYFRDLANGENGFPKPSRGLAVQLRPGGGVSMLGFDSEGLVLTRLDARGRPVRRTGPAGRRSLPGRPPLFDATRSGPRANELELAVPDGDGFLVVGQDVRTRGQATRALAVVRLRGDGTRDRSFGARGVRTFGLSPNERGSRYAPAELVRLADGKLLIGGSIVFDGIRSGPEGRFFLLRLSPGGANDRTFGRGGLVQRQLGSPLRDVYSPGRRYASARALTVDAEGRPSLAGFVYFDYEADPSAPLDNPGLARFTDAVAPAIGLRQRRGRIDVTCPRAETTCVGEIRRRSGSTPFELLAGERIGVRLRRGDRVSIRVQDEAGNGVTRSFTGR